MLFRIIIFIIFSITNLYAENLKKCDWDNRKGIPCIVISKTPNTSEISEIGINKIIISKKEIEDLGAVDVNDILKNISGLDQVQKDNDIIIYKRIRKSYTGND